MNRRCIASQPTPTPLTHKAEAGETCVYIKPVRLPATLPTMVCFAIATELPELGADAATSVG